MSNHGDEPDLTRAISLETDATGVIPVTSGPETGEIRPVNSEEISAAFNGVAKLVVRRGAQEGMTFPLQTDEIMTIGRSSDSKIFLDDVTVSRKHAAIAFEVAEWVITDSGSLNGTYVNKQRVSSVMLNNGDELQIGKFRFVFVLAPASGQ
jgi:pSer/pThr/pTyr-binding forkhead associated (FHA) protein